MLVADKLMLMADLPAEVSSDYLMACSPARQCCIVVLEMASTVEMGVFVERKRWGATRMRFLFVRNGMIVIYESYRTTDFTLKCLLCAIGTCSGSIIFSSFSPFISDSTAVGEIEVVGEIRAVG